MIQIIEKLINHGPISAWDNNGLAGKVVVFYTPYNGPNGHKSCSVLIFERVDGSRWMEYPWDMNKITRGLSNDVASQPNR